MKVRADIAELLRDGVPVYKVARQLRVSVLTIVDVRDRLGIPVLPGGRHFTMRQQFQARTEPADGGHLRWVGQVKCGRPVMVVRNKGVAAYVVAFRLQYGREPVGHVQPGCEHDWCVAPGCVEDRPMREQYAGIFGGGRS